MEKRNIFAGIGIAFLIAAVAFILLSNPRDGKITEETLAKIKDSEKNLVKYGIKNTAGFYAKYEKIDLEYYYQYGYCLDAVKAAVQKFNGAVKIIKTGKISKIKGDFFKNLDMQENAIEFPVALISGSAELYDYGNNYLRAENSLNTLISGIAACSEPILTYNLCSYLKNRSNACAGISVQEQNIAEEKTSPHEPACYDSCNVKYLNANKIISGFWQGPPCSKVSWYAESESRQKAKACYGESCRNDERDLACCRQTECVDMGNCFPLSAARDIDANGHLEVCALVGDSAEWANPDINADICLSARFKWIDCTDKNECRYGVNDYNKKSNGLCCGDDKNERAVRCSGKLCLNENDTSCCPASTCVFNGKCYPSGCNDIEVNAKEKISAFCQGSTGAWQDLDEGNCAECLGKKAWSGTICCGDDVNEGKHPIQFILNNKNGTAQFPFFGCADKKSDCSYPISDALFAEGLYVFKENSQYLRGAYYCRASQWYSLDTNKKYCMENGYYWDSSNRICCGDNPNEFFINETDGTSACCNLSSDYVVNGVCRSSLLCGNNLLDRGEACESPDTENNSNCRQQETQCLGNKLGTRSSSGYCNKKCLCDETQFDYSCAKNKCGAQCGIDEDCGQGMRCDSNTCGCIAKTSCGDNIVQNYNNFGQKEECELPNTMNNTYCKLAECKDKKSAAKIADSIIEYGLCSGNCKCDYGLEEYSCRKGYCKAECNEDGSGCGDGATCNKDTCNCAPPVLVCGDGICKEGEENSCPSDCKLLVCPYRIRLNLNKSVYRFNETIGIKIETFDRENNPIPYVKFELDIMINDILVGTASYSSSSDGDYKIKKKVTNLYPGGLHRYTVRARVDQCGVLSDTGVAYIMVDNPNKFSARADLSKFEFVVNDFGKRADKPAKCGDGAISPGESCEGQNICRAFSGCDYQNKLYDYPEYCSGCQCPSDRRSEPNDESYCSKCSHCGDNEVNCGEACESGTLEFGTICRYGSLYSRVDTCSNCRWDDDGINKDILLDNCLCKCPENPEKNCINGNYVNYTIDYSAGCADGKCNSCSCQDTYKKDSNSDGIEDKCETERCGNNIDDNDNGLIDEGGCFWYYCTQCGYGLFSFCTRQDCAKIQEGCFFSEYGNFNLLFGLFNSSAGKCSPCSSIETCEGYKLDNLTCQKDSCSIGNCIWNGTQCCADKDKDRICDFEDNCPEAHNSYQQDSDKDGKGDACDKCPNEPLLAEPTENNETICSDGIDNDCNGFADCEDPNCSGKGQCCRTATDCRQSKCFIENCIANKCDYQIRPLCDYRECPKGNFCDFDGECRSMNESIDLCMLCSANTQDCNRTQIK